MSSIGINRKREPQIIFPAQISEQKYIGELKGYYVENTNTYNVLPFDSEADIKKNKIYSLGFILPVSPFKFLDKEIASRIKYLKSEEFTPNEISEKIRQAMQNPTINTESFFGKLTSNVDLKNDDTDLEAIREAFAKQQRVGKSIELNSSGNVITNSIEPDSSSDAMWWDGFAKEVSDLWENCSSTLDNETDRDDNLVKKTRTKLETELKFGLMKLWVKTIFVNGLCRRRVHIDPTPSTTLLAENEIVGYWEDDELHFIQLGSRRECKQDKYSLKLDVFSRNTGILESDIMLEKGAMFIGCGSVGSLFALELAKAGVGRFLLIDNDIFGYHNICRHQCGIYDVGRFKTDALAERILQVNPYAKIVTQNRMIQDVPVNELVEFCDRNTIVIGGADNREGDLYANNLAQEIEMPFMSIGCWERAFAGEIFYCLPKNMPNYQDFMEVSGLLSARVNQNRRFYTTEDDLKKVTFEPGISADINFVTIIAVKMALDILNIGNENYTQRLLPYLTQYTLVCNTNNKQIGGETAEIFSYPLQITTSIRVPYSKK